MFPFFHFVLVIMSMAVKLYHHCHVEGLTLTISLLLYLSVFCVTNIFSVYFKSNINGYGKETNISIQCKKWQQQQQKT